MLIECQNKLQPDTSDSVAANHYHNMLIVDSIVEEIIVSVDANPFFFVAYLKGMDYFESALIELTDEMFVGLCVPKAG